MSRNHIFLVGTLFGVLSILTTNSEAQGINEEKTLSERQKSIVEIAAFTASGDLERLRAALNEGLDSDRIDPKVAKNAEEVLTRLLSRRE